jgi:hypothetical protein
MTTTNYRDSLTIQCYRISVQVCGGPEHIQQNLWHHQPATQVEERKNPNRYERAGKD